MKKRLPGHLHHQHYRWTKNFGILFLGVVFVFFMFKIQELYRAQFTLNFGNLPLTYSGKPKIAFLFLARNRLPLDFVWQHFFQGVDHVYYETEYRTEWCNSNGKSSPCFLFARKFSRGAAIRLLNQVNFDHQVKPVPDAKLEPVLLAKLDGIRSVISL